MKKKYILEIAISIEDYVNHFMKTRSKKLSSNNVKRTFTTIFRGSYDIIASYLVNDSVGMQNMGLKGERVNIMNQSFSNGVAKIDYEFSGRYYVFKDDLKKPLINAEIDLSETSQAKQQYIVFELERLYELKGGKEYEIKRVKRKITHKQTMKKTRLICYNNYYKKLFVVIDERQRDNVDKSIVVDKAYPTLALARRSVEQEIDCIELDNIYTIGNSL